MDALVVLSPRLVPLQCVGHPAIATGQWTADEVQCPTVGRREHAGAWGENAGAGTVML